MPIFKGATSVPSITWDLCSDDDLDPDAQAVGAWLDSVDAELATGNPRVARTPMNTGVLRRADSMVKKAADKNWDDEMENIQSHVSGILGNLGNGR